MCIVAEIWQQCGLKQDTVVTKLIFKFISQALETLFLTNCVPSGPRQEAKLVVCLYKMLTTCLTALIFGSGKYRH